MTKKYKNPLSNRYQKSSANGNKFLVVVDDTFIQSEDTFDQVVEALEEYGISASVYELTENDIQIGGKE